jgi:uncharacterized protein
MPKTPRLDRRAPLVLDTVELGRRPGSMRRVSRTVPAPDGLGLDLAHVPPGSELSLRLQLEAVVEGVLVTGTVTAGLVGECGRCLAPLTQAVDAPLQELYLYPGAEPDDEQAPRVVEDLINLEQAVRDAVVLALPMTPLCRADCPGLCPTCGVPLSTAPADHFHETVDPRWAALGKMYDEIAPER